MSQPILFELPPPLEESAGEANRAAAFRRQARDRQRRCRARRKWRAQMINAPLDQVARIGAREQALRVNLRRWNDDERLAWIRAQNVVIGALMHGGEPARQALELVNPRATFDERLSAVWDAMEALHRRGATINGRTVREQLKRGRVLVLLEMQWLDDGTMPRPDVAQTQAAAALIGAVAGEPGVRAKREAA